jgi:8-oxo-dGTP pyrophosphatase MutT (NUDIX family)
MTVEPGSCGSAGPLEGYDEKARMRGRIYPLNELRKYLSDLREKGINIYGAVLILLSKNLTHVLLERKSCKVRSHWSCDVALPGGKIERGEDILSTALREAWEEAWIPPAYVNPIGFLDVHRTLSKPIYVIPIVALENGPIDPKPSSEEVDMVFWFQLKDIDESRVNEVKHPVRGYVKGISIHKDIVLWGLTLRILLSLKKALENKVKNIKDFYMH